MMAKARLGKLLLAVAMFISTASTSALYAAVTVSTPAEPIILGVQATTDVPVDVDGDGSMDFTFKRTSMFGLFLEPTTSGRIVVTTAGGRVTPLSSGVRIGSTLDLQGTEWAGRSDISSASLFPYYACEGQFCGRDAYIGIEFPIDGNVHYGWIRFDHFEISPGGWILEWAYETRPRVPIKAGAKPVVVPTTAPEVARPGYVRLKWPSEVGTAYQVQTKARMDALRWTNLSFVIVATASETMVDLPMEGAAQFFRVVEAD